MESFIIYPALLFPAIPLMMTNFTHRYNSCAALVRKIHAEIIEKKIDTKDVMGRRYIAQIKTLTYRIKLIKLIQTLSGIALFSNLLTIFFGYIHKPDISLNISGRLSIAYLMLAVNLSNIFSGILTSLDHCSALDDGMLKHMP